MPRRSGPVITAIVVAGVGALVTLTIFGEVQAQRTMGLLGLDIAVGVLSCALLPVLLRWPVVGGLVLAVLAAVSPAATPAAT
ncbi:MAG: Signal transduction histidine kinaselike protein, partial [Actinomycetia bacterium]|nr:Signal transduction histidine kinaselike protein [Actinomycetes bacterium]